jgi:hypothetical protein
VEEKIMLKYVALGAMLLTTPTFAEEKEPEPCHIFHSGNAFSTGHDLYLDLIRNDDCKTHARGYIRGVAETGDESWYSLPTKHLTYGDIFVIYRIWVMKNLDDAHKQPSAVCVVRSLNELFPLKKKEKKEEEDAGTQS